jgi:hypothetical protein
MQELISTLIFTNSSKASPPWIPLCARFLLASSGSFTSPPFKKVSGDVDDDSDQLRGWNSQGRSTVHDQFEDSTKNVDGWRDIRGTLWTWYDNSGKLLVHFAYCGLVWSSLSITKRDTQAYIQTTDRRVCAWARKPCYCVLLYRLLANELSGWSAISVVLIWGDKWHSSSHCVRLPWNGRINETETRVSAFLRVD